MWILCYTHMANLLVGTPASLVVHVLTGKSSAPTSERVHCLTHKLECLLILGRSFVLGLQFK